MLVIFHVVLNPYSHTYHFWKSEGILSNKIMYAKTSSLFVGNKFLKDYYLNLQLNVSLHLINNFKETLMFAK